MAQSISWGSINVDGSILSGSGDFTVTNTTPGQYQIAFNQGFTSTPAVVGSQNRFNYAAEANTDSVCFPSVNQNSFQANTGTASGSPQNRSFAFVAIGNR